MSDDTDDASSAPVLSGEDDWIEYAVGNPQFRGRTTVRVEGDGRVVVRSESDEDEREFEETLPDDRLTEFRETLVTSDPRDLSSNRETGVPDEARIEIRFSFDGEDGVREFWDNERHEMNELGRLVTAFEEIAADVSDGEVTY